MVVIACAWCSCGSTLSFFLLFFIFALVVYGFILAQNNLICILRAFYYHVQVFLLMDCFRIILHKYYNLLVSNCPFFWLQKHVSYVILSVEKLILQILSVKFVNLHLSYTCIFFENKKSLLYLHLL